MQNKFLVRYFVYLITFLNVFSIQAQCDSVPKLVEVYGSGYYKCDWYYDSDYFGFLLTDSIEEPLECVVEFFDYSDTMYVNILEIVKFSTDNNQMYPNHSPMQISIKDMDNAYVPGDRDAFRIRFHVENSCGKSNYVYDESFFTENNTYKKYPDNDSCAIGEVYFVGPTTFSCSNQTNVYKIKYNNAAKLPDLFRWITTDSKGDMLDIGSFRIGDSLVLNQWQDSVVNIVLYTYEECTCSKGIFFNNYSGGHKINLDTLTVSFQEGNGVCGVISGYVKTSEFEDCNNQTQDVPNRLVCLGNNQYVATNEEGYYSASLPYGTYAVSLLLKGYEESCQPNDSVTLSDVNQTETKNLSYKYNDEVKEDVKLCLFGGQGRVGQDQIARIHIDNEFKPIVNGKLTCHVPDNIELGSMTPYPDSISDNQLIWDNLSLNSFESRKFVLNFTVKNSAPMGDSLYWRALFIGDDSIFYDEDKVVVRNSYDPNAIVVNHTALLVSEKHHRLKYTVHFQNTGNDTAYLVRVVDTLDSKIDISTLELAGSSHLFEFAIKPGLAMEWTFPEINLLDSASNEAKSKGYFQFFAQLKSDVKLHDKAKSTAYIYFDTNEPIITNTAITNIVEPTSPNILTSESSIIAFPNPTKGVLYFDRLSTITSYTIHNLDGRIVGSGILDEGIGQVQFNSLASGVYYIRLVNSTNQTQVIKVNKL